MTSRSVLKEIYFERKKKNDAYSLRAFARDLGVSPTYVSLLFSESKPLTRPLLKRLQLKFQLTESQNKQLKKLIDTPTSVLPFGKSKVLKKRSLKAENLEFLANWLPLAVLECLQIFDDPQQDKKIAKYLGVALHEVKDSIALLSALDLLSVTSSGLKKSAAHIDIVNNAPRSWVADHHKVWSEKAAEILDHRTPDDFYTRAITGRLLSLDVDKIPMAKKLIEKFMDELTMVMAGGEGVAESKALQQKPQKHVFRLNVQLFQVGKTKLINAERKKKK